MPQISVIVPVYNTEKYIKRCVDSIITQTFSDFELLLVDDGSTDESPAICDNYTYLDQRVTVFHKTNGGVSSARNFGLAQAKGQWVTFIDADDWIEAKYLGSLLPQKDEELCVNSYTIEGGNENWKSISKAQSINLTNSNDFDANEILSLIEFQVPWCKLFSTKIIIENNISFNEKIHSGEDTLFVLEYLERASKIRMTPEPLYHYFRGNTESLSKVDKDITNNMLVYKAEKIFDAYSAVESIYGFDCSSVKKKCTIKFTNKWLSILPELRFRDKLELTRNMIKTDSVMWLVSKGDTIITGKKKRLLVFLIKHKLASTIILFNKIFPNIAY